MRMRENGVGGFTYQSALGDNKLPLRSCDERRLYEVGGLKRTGRAMTKTVKMESLAYATTGSSIVVLMCLRREWD